MTNILNMQKTMDEGIEPKQKNKESFDEMYVKTFGKIPDVKKENTFENNATNINLASVENISVFEKNEDYTKIPNYKYIGALFSTYIVIEIKDEIYIIDQHAAHERVM